MGGEGYWRDVFFCLVFVASGIGAIWKGRIEIQFNGVDDDKPIDPDSPWYRQCTGPVARYGGVAMMIAGALVWVHWLLGFFAFFGVVAVMWLMAAR